MTDVSTVPAFIRGWTAPFHVTMDGIKDSNGCWICTAANNKLAHELVELMNYAAAQVAVVDALREARKWIDGQPARSSCKYSTQFALEEAIDAVLGPFVETGV